MSNTDDFVSELFTKLDALHPQMLTKRLPRTSNAVIKLITDLVAEEERLIAECIKKNKTITLLKEELSDQESLRVDLRRRLANAREDFKTYGMHTPRCPRWSANFEDIGSTPLCDCGFDTAHAHAERVEAASQLEPVAERIARWLEKGEGLTAGSVVAQAIRDGKYR